MNPNEIDLDLPFEEIVMDEVALPERNTTPYPTEEGLLPEAFSRVHFSSVRHDWRTPLDLFRRLDDEFHFTTDLAASRESTLCINWLGPDHPEEIRRDALNIPWYSLAEGNLDRIVGFLNPPYGRTIDLWVQKAIEAKECGSIVVMLLPARTGTRWFQRLIEEGHAEVRFLRGRLRFQGAEASAPFDSLIAVLKPSGGWTVLHG